MISIRSYHPSDAERLVTVYRDAVRSTAGRDYTDGQTRAWAPDSIDPDAFGQRCQSKSTWVAKIDGQARGFSDLESNGHIDMLFVHPDYQRRGVATALLDHVEDLARLRGLRRLYVEASITARAVFEARGYRIVLQQTVSIRGAQLANFKMEKLLSPPAVT